jgi:hypothetical protein
METKRRQQILLGALFVVLAVVLYRAFASGPSAVALPSSNPTGTTVARRATAAPPSTAPDVHLDALDAERPSPVGTHRDLFRFKPKAPPAPRVPVTTAPTAPPVATGPPPPPPPPPIPYKFIGILTGQAKKIAVLSDGRGGPVYGVEGDIIEGRYRIIRIGVESIEMEHLDGRGRQTIRLTGS